MVDRVVAGRACRHDGNRQTAAIRRLRDQSGEPQKDFNCRPLRIRPGLWREGDAAEISAKDTRRVDKQK